MKDELSGSIMKEFTALIPKIYTYFIYTYESKGYKEMCNSKRNQGPRLQRLPGKYQQSSEVNYTMNSPKK